VDDRRSLLGVEVADAVDDEADPVQVDLSLTEHREQLRVLLGEGDGQVDPLLGSVAGETERGPYFVGGELPARLGQHDPVVVTVVVRRDTAGDRLNGIE
jgi:hypothetical protein